MTFLIMTISFISCKENSLEGRIYTGVYDVSTVTLSFDKDGYAFFEIENKESAQLEYSANKDSFSGACVSHPAMDFHGKYDDDSLLWIWWGGHPVVLERADSGKKVKSSNNSAKHNKSITGRTYAGIYDDSFVTISFEKFGLAIVGVDDEMDSYFYTEDTKAHKIKLREYDSDSKNILTLKYNNESLWGTDKDDFFWWTGEEEIRLKNLDNLLSFYDE